MKQPKKKKKASDADYVSNQELYDALVEYRKKSADADNAGRKKPKLPDFIVLILQIIHIEKKWYQMQY